MMEADSTHMATTVGELVHDAIGRVTLRAGGRLLETAYRPVFAHDGDILHPVFVTAECRAVSPNGTMGEKPVTLPGRAGERVTVAMHRANLFLRDPETMGYCETLTLSGASGQGALTQLAEMAEEAGLEPGSVWWHCPSGGGQRRLEAMALARELGLRICVSLPEGAADLLSIDGLMPDLVRLGREWAPSGLGQVPGATSLLRGLCDRLGGRDVPVWIDGIENAGDLDAALGAGVRFVSGAWTGSPVIAGRVSGWRPLNAAALRMPAEGPVVALLRRS